MHSALLALLLALLACPALLAKQHINATFGEPAQQQGLVFGLHTREGVVRGRGLLRKGTLPISGAVREVGYFYATIGLGTPTRTFDLIIDTGSTISYVPCKDCRHCGKHKDAAFDVAASKTAVRLGCGVPLCNCGSPPCQCVDDKCYYSRSYAEMSSSAGFLIEDHFAFPDDKGPVRLVFGCEADETGEIFRQQADGILGMGNNNNAFQSQLVEQKAIENTFSLCFGYPSGGTMILGYKPLANQQDMKYTPLKPGAQVHYYTVITEAITVDGAKVNVPASLYAVGYGSVVDSGTTFTYIPSAAFQGLVQMVDKAAKAKGLQRTPGSDPQYNDVCWKTAPDNALDTVFPKLAFVFEPNVVVNMVPVQYLFKMAPGSYCLGIFDNGRAGTLIGGISVRGVLVQYDRRNHRVGFLDGVDCNNLAYAPEHSPVPSPVPKRSPVRKVMPPRPGHSGKRTPAPSSPAAQSQEPQQQQPQPQGAVASPASGSNAGTQGQSAAGLPSPSGGAQGGPAAGTPAEEGPDTDAGAGGEGDGDGFELVDGSEGRAGGLGGADAYLAPGDQESLGSGVEDDGEEGEDEGGDGEEEDMGQSAGAMQDQGYLAGSGTRMESGASSKSIGASHVAGAVVGMVLVVVAIQLAYTYRQSLYTWYAGGYRRLVQLPEVGMQPAQGSSARGSGQDSAAQRTDLP